MVGRKDVYLQLGGVDATSSKRGKRAPYVEKELR